MVRMLERHQISIYIEYIRFQPQNFDLHPRNFNLQTHDFNLQQLIPMQISLDSNLQPWDFNLHLNLQSFDYNLLNLHHV